VIDCINLVLPSLIYGLISSKICSSKEKFISSKTISATTSKSQRQAKNITTRIINSKDNFFNCRRKKFDPPLIFIISKIVVLKS
jgi:hypothetical protein